MRLNENFYTLLADYLRTTACDGDKPLAVDTVKKVIFGFKDYVSAELIKGKDVNIPRFGKFDTITKTCAMNFMQDKGKVERVIVRFKPYNRLLKKVRG